MANALSTPSPALIFRFTRLVVKRFFPVPVGVILTRCAAFISIRHCFPCFRVLLFIVVSRPHQDHRISLGIAHTSQLAYVYVLIAFVTRHSRARDSCRTSSPSVSGMSLATVVYTLDHASLVSIFLARRKSTLSHGRLLLRWTASVDTSTHTRAAGLPHNTCRTRGQVVHTLLFARANIIV